MKPENPVTPSPPVWACPVCHAQLELREKQWQCEQNHCFDMAKEGYTNLLLSNQKKASDPGDSKAMLNSRRAFLQAGYYAPLADKLSGVLTKRLPTAATVLDTGCGEGYYLRQFHQQNPKARIFGTDISRDAARLAAKHLKAGQFAVASNFNLPVMSQSVDAVLRIFAPGDDAEVARVLKPRGIFIVVSPGAKHLFELKTILYQQATEHDPAPVPEGFQLQNEYRIDYPFEATGTEAIGQLLSMTPFFWKGSRETKATFQSMTRLATRADFLVRLYSLKEPSIAPR